MIKVVKTPPKKSGRPVPHPVHLSLFLVSDYLLSWGVLPTVEKVCFGSIWSILIVIEPYVPFTIRNLSAGVRYPLPPIEWISVQNPDLTQNDSSSSQCSIGHLRVLRHNWDRKWLNAMQTDGIWWVLMNTTNMIWKIVGQNLLASNTYITDLLLRVRF